MIQRSFRISCDECNAHSDDTSLLSEARADARKQGFIRRGGEDLCITCKLYPCPVCGKEHRVKRETTTCDECKYSAGINRNISRDE